MGYTTDFLGHIEIAPALNTAEQQYLTAFGQSRRWQRSGGPYAVPANPAAEFAHEPDDTDAYNTPAAGQPSLWCGWQPCFEGCCLSHDGSEKFYAASLWLAYLIEHFLAPDAVAESAASPWLREFTFDHVLNGIIAACRRDTRELYLIHVEDNLVLEEPLWSPSTDIGPFPPLPYEEALDEARGARRRRPAG